MKLVYKFFDAEEIILITRSLRLFGIIYGMFFAINIINSIELNFIAAVGIGLATLIEASILYIIVVIVIRIINDHKP